MRIAHVVRQYYPSIGGFEEVVRNLCKHQQLAGHNPYVITLDRYFKELHQVLPERETIDNVEVIRIPFKGSTRYPIAPSVLKHIKDADIIHVHAIDFFYDFLALTKVLHHKKMVVSTHGGFFHTNYASNFKKFFFNTITRVSAFFYHRVIASSENDAEIFKTIISDKRLVTIENGVDIEKLNVDNKSEFPPTLLYFGRWSVNKGIFDALTLFKRLVDLDPDVEWRFIIAGRPYDLNKNDIYHRIIQLKLNQKVEVVDNPDTVTLRELTIKSSYFISLSEFEGFGIAPIEAMSAGLNPLLSNIPPFVKLLEKVDQGFLIKKPLLDNQIYEIIQHYQKGDFAPKPMKSSIREYAWNGVNLKYLEAYQ